MESDLKYVNAPPGWSCKDPNPFTADGAYGNMWSTFCVQDRDDDQFFTGQEGNGPFSARFGRRVPHLEHHLADFLRYENRYGRTVVLSLPETMDCDRFVAQSKACTPDARIVRPQDVPVIVHSTTQAAWESIQSDGEIKAASHLTSQRDAAFGSRKTGPVAEYLSHEPLEYNDYIMFGEVDSYVPEIVVASNQAGCFVMDVNAFYQPGVRLYFDNHRIFRDGLGVRDGLHIIKVHQRLALQPYLLAAIGVRDLQTVDHNNRWTLKAFVEKANEAFNAISSSGGRNIKDF